MRFIEQCVVSTRVISTICHLLSLAIVVFTREANIAVGLADNVTDDRKDYAHDITNGALTVGMFCFLWDIVSLLGGYSMFIMPINIIQILSHFCGGLLLSWFITQSWTYEALWPIVIACNIPVALIEVGVLLSTHVFKTLTP